MDIRRNEYGSALNYRIVKNEQLITEKTLNNTFFKFTF